MMTGVSQCSANTNAVVLHVRVDDVEPVRLAPRDLDRVLHVARDVAAVARATTGSASTVGMSSYGHLRVAGRDQRDVVAAPVELVTERSDDPLGAGVGRRRHGEHRRRDEQDRRRSRPGRSDAVPSRPTCVPIASIQSRPAHVTVGRAGSRPLRAHRDARRVRRRHRPPAQASGRWGRRRGPWGRRRGGRASTTVTRTIAGSEPCAESGAGRADTTSSSRR